MNSTLNPEAAGFDPARLARIDEHFQRAYVEPGKIAGYQIAVGRRGHLAHRSAGGTMDLETGEPLHDQTIWRLYSMSKPITGVALLSLIERARVKLNDPISRFLPEWRDVKVSVRQGDGTFALVEPDRPISVKHALMHMTGIGPGPKEARLDFARLVDGEARSLDPSATLADLSRLLATEPLWFHPGTQWFYSWSSDICARLVEVIADEPFGDYLRRAIFDPLGMDDTGFHVPESDAHRVPSLYARTARREVRLIDDRSGKRLCREPAMQSGGGGLVGSLDDYARFCAALTAGGVLDGARILGRPTVELMRTNHLPGSGDLRDFALPGGYGEVGFDGNGFGLQVAVGLGPAATAGVGPAGDFMWGGAASTSFWIDPTEDLYAIFMTQLLPSGTYDFRGQLRSLVYGAIAD
ncbi:MAG: class C beta-lactamase-related serine hydrolase [Acidimicrobiales bacterium]|nr:MAG: class C beta-lactamase-related serine hydrolase [Acidimicrobiales bacterium]